MRPPLTSSLLGCYTSLTFRQPSDLGTFGESSMASRRKRGPVALRLWLWPDLPLSDVTTVYGETAKTRLFAVSLSKQCLCQGETRHFGFMTADLCLLTSQVLMKLKRRLGVQGVGKSRFSVLALGSFAWIVVIDLVARISGIGPPL